MNDNYQSILYLSYQKSKRRPHLSISQRAAQFAPFAALTGHDQAVIEAARLTTDKIELADSAQDILNMKLQMINEFLSHQSLVKITYFKNDDRKSGGAYMKIEGVVKRIDDYNHHVIMMNGLHIPIQDILDIECQELFSYDEALS